MLFRALSMFGFEFEPKLLSMIIERILIPQFGTMFPATDEKMADIDEEWLVTTCLKVLHNLVLIFSSLFDKIPLMLTAMLDLLTKFIVDGNESLATFGATCLELLLSLTGERFNPDQWSQVTTTINSTVRRICPVEMFDPEEPPAPEVLEEQPATDVNALPGTDTTTTTTSTNQGSLSNTNTANAKMPSMGSMGSTGPSNMGSMGSMSSMGSSSNKNAVIKQNSQRDL